MADKFELTDGEPAAPGGKVNVKWQTDGNGNISAHIDPVIGPEGPQGPPGPPGDPATQTPWAQNVDAAGFDLNGAGWLNAASGAVNPNATGAGVIIREANRGGWIGSADNAPRLTFQWSGAATSQIGIDSGGTFRTFDFAGTAYAPFAAAQIESKSGGFRFPDGTTQVTAWSANASVNAQTGTSYTLVSGDNGKIVTLSNAAAITLTVPAGLGSGFSCLIVQLGAGKVTVTASGVTVVQRQSFTKTAGQYAVASLLAYAANVFALSGDLSA